MTCEDCIHYEICNSYGRLISDTRLYAEKIRCFESKTLLSEEEWKLLFGALGVAHGAYWNRAVEDWARSEQAFSAGDHELASKYETFARADDKMLAEIVCFIKKLRKLKERTENLL